MSKIIQIFVLLFITGSFNANSQSIDDFKENNSYYKSFSYFTGFSKGELSEKDDYIIVPSIFRFAFDMDKLEIGAADIAEYIADKVFNNPRLIVQGETEFLAELFFNTIVSPNNNLEVGFDLLVKYSYPVTEKINPYFFSGGGIIFMTQHTNEQSTQFNFIPQIGVGVSYELRDDMSIDFEYRYRHLSNANRKLPNDGINVNMFLAGITWKY